MSPYFSQFSSFFSVQFIIYKYVYRIKKKEKQQTFLMRKAEEHIVQKVIMKTWIRIFIWKPYGITITQCTISGNFHIGIINEIFSPYFAISIWIISRYILANIFSHLCSVLVIHNHYLRKNCFFLGGGQLLGTIWWKKDAPALEQWLVSHSLVLCLAQVYRNKGKFSQ